MSCSFFRPFSPVQEDEIAALFRTLQQLGFCSSELHPFSGGAETGRHGSAVLTEKPDNRDARRDEGPHGGEIGPPKIDAILHSIAHAPTEAMQKGSFLQVFGICGRGEN